MIIGVTGHRFLDGRGVDAGPKRAFVKERTTALLKEMVKADKDTTVITGMAIGFDMLVAEVCIEQKIPYIAAVPFRGQERRWPLNQQELYRLLLRCAAAVNYGAGELTEYNEIRAALLNRNEWIVSHADFMLAAWHGSAQGGTAHCVRHTLARNKFVLQINPETKEVKWLPK